MFSKAIYFSEKHEPADIGSNLKFAIVNNHCKAEWKASLHKYLQALGAAGMINI